MQLNYLSEKNIILNIKLKNSFDYSWFVKKVDNLVVLLQLKYEYLILQLRYIDDWHGDNIIFSFLLVFLYFTYIIPLIWGGSEIFNSYKKNW